MKSGAWLAAAALIASAALHAAPHRPASDDVVLERLPGGTDAVRLASLRTAADGAGSETDRARALARAYLDVGRREGEPRLVAYAATVIAPAIARSDATADDLVLGATAAQYLHDFDRALPLLARALQVDGRHAQALLTQADLLEVRGDFTAARASCAKLVQVSAPLVAIACLTSIDSRTGRLADSYARLRDAYTASPGLPPEIDAWLLMILADMADRSGDAEAQGRWLALAREREPLDLKVLAAATDWSLARGDARGVLARKPAESIGDPMLLRLAIAAKRAGDSRYAAWAEEFRQRQRLAAGDARHLREWARFALEVDDDAPTALRHARENWQHQREPEDLRLLWAASRAAGDASSRAEAEAWIAAHRYEDRTLR